MCTPRQARMWPQPIAAAEGLSAGEHRHLWMFGRRHAHRHGTGVVPEENLPTPGAAGVLCAGLIRWRETDLVATRPTPACPPARVARHRSPVHSRAPGHAVLQRRFTTGSARGARKLPDVLAKFPPTLFISSTRGFDLSAASYTHGLLVKAGVETELHVWDGMFHGFFYNIDVPESRDCFEVIVRFFNRHLGNRAVRPGLIW